MVANHIFYHTPIWKSEWHPITYPDGIFLEPISQHDKNVKLQFDNKLFWEIEMSASNWLLADLYSLVTPRIYLYDGFLYSDFNKKISAALKAKNVLPWKDETVLGNWDEILNKTLPWCELVKHKYGNNIVLLSSLQSEFWIGDDDQIYQWEQREEIKEKTAL